MSSTFSSNLLGSDVSTNKYQEYVEQAHLFLRHEKIIRDQNKIQANKAAYIGKSSTRDKTKLIPILQDISSNIILGFSDVTSGIFDLINLTDDRLSTLIEDQRITNLLLNNIEALLGLPNGQKNRAYYIEEGLKFILSADKEGERSEWYGYAMVQFSKAIKIEANDFFSLYYVGYIYLHAIEYFTLENFKKAEDCFKEAAKHFAAEANIGGTTFSKNLLPKGIIFSLQGAQSLLYAARACYLQGKLKDAIAFCQKAQSADNRVRSAALFFEAKYEAADSNPSNSITCLDKAIEIAPHNYNSAFDDEDINSSQEIVLHLTAMRDSLAAAASEIMLECEKFMIDDSVASTYMRAIESHLQSEDYPAILLAYQMLTNSKDWKIASGANIDNAGRISPKVSPLNFSGTLLAFLKFERAAVESIPVAQNLGILDNLRKDQRDLHSKMTQLTIDATVALRNIQRYGLIALIVTGIEIATIRLRIENPHDGAVQLFCGLGDMILIISFLYQFYRLLGACRRLFAIYTKKNEFENQVGTLQGMIQTLEHNIGAQRDELVAREEILETAWELDKHHLDGIDEQANFKDTKTEKVKPNWIPFWGPIVGVGVTVFVLTFIYKNVAGDKNIYPVEQGRRPVPDLIKAIGGHQRLMPRDSIPKVLSVELSGTQIYARSLNGIDTFKVDSVSGEHEVKYIYAIRLVDNNWYPAGTEPKGPVSQILLRAKNGGECQLRLTIIVKRPNH